MATKYVCDRCHAEFISPLGIVRFKLPIAVKDTITIEDRDLCKKCAEELVDWLESNKTK